jgi:hypothetical protein
MNIDIVLLYKYDITNGMDHITAYLYDINKGKMYNTRGSTEYFASEGYLEVKSITKRVFDLFVNNEEKLHLKR